MDFMGIGGLEIVLILFVALLVMGPVKVVEMGRTLGKMVRAFKKATTDLTTQISKEMEGEDKTPPSKKDPD